MPEISVRDVTVRTTATARATRTSSSRGPRGVAPRRSPTRSARRVGYAGRRGLCAISAALRATGSRDAVTFRGGLLR
jgi:hypothetical protein